MRDRRLTRAIARVFRARAAIHVATVTALILGVGVLSATIGTGDASARELERGPAFEDRRDLNVRDWWNWWRRRTPTPRPTVQPTSSPTPTATRTPAPTATATATPQPTASATPTATATPKVTATATATATATPKVTATATATATATPKVTATATATATATPKVTATPTSTATPGAKFTTLPPRSTLPSGEECAARVRRSSWEPRSANNTANHTVPPKPAPSSMTTVWNFNSTHATRIDGNFTGTTDEILQWAACKWGFSEDVTRARAVTESYWQQSAAGDNTSSSSTCAQIGKSAPCAESYGILQVRFTAHAGTYPASVNSTAFNADYALAVLRTCYEGQYTWLQNGYAAGDEWGCVGLWFSGNWKDQAALNYISVVQGHLNSRTWEQGGF